jgi:DNA polymerase-3 subunit beta
MKVTAERAALLKSLSHVQSVVERRNTIPILSNLMLKAEEGRLSLTATDLDIEAIETMDAKVESAGAVTAPAQTLYEIVRKLPDGSEVSLSLNIEDQRLTVSSGRSRFALATLPSSDYPVMASSEYGHHFEMTAGELSRLFEKTRFAISTEETRYYLNGVYLHVVEGHLRAVATDGHRLARVDMPMPNGAADMPGVIVPRKTVAELGKLLEDKDAVTQIGVSEAKIRISCGRMVLTSKVIDGQFPDYTRVIPVGNDKTLTVDAKMFASAVDRVATVSSEKSRAVKLALDEDKLTLSVNSPESGTADEEMVVAYASEPMSIGFNAKYLTEIAGQIERENALFEFADSAAPTLVREAGDDDVIYVVMPMRV